MDYKISFVLNNTPLYRIMPLKWFEIMVKDKSNTLIKPSTWDDPYETNYSKSVIATEHGDVPLDASHWFGQCWSVCKESAVMWQAFKKNKEPYVKIEIDAFNLIKGLVDQDDNLRIAVLEHIRYFSPTTDDYEEKIKDVIEMHQWPANFIKQGIKLAELYPMYNLLTKRDVFKHEEEVRLLLFDKSSSEERESVSYSFDPLNIKEVVIDPWTSLDDEKLRKIKTELQCYLSSETTRICKSEVFFDSSKFITKYIIKNNKL